MFCCTWENTYPDDSKPATNSAAHIAVLVPHYGGRVDWGRNDLIVFDKIRKDGWFEIWTMKSDGSDQHCLTCGRSNIPSLHNGNPAWHPSGHFVVFQSLDTNVRAPLAGLKIYQLYTNPGAGFHNNIWMMSADGLNAWQFTDVGKEGGVLHPHFSHDGSMLIWAEMINPKPKPHGTWVIMKAAFAVQAGRPVLGKVETMTPGNMQFYETHGFTPEDDCLLFTGMPFRGKEKDFDIYKYHLASKTLQVLTDPKMEEWDEHAHVSPQGDKIIWMSSMGNNLDPSKLNQLQVKTDYWVMNVDGSGKRRLTRFNVSGVPEHIPGRTIAADVSWSPDGNKVVGYIQDNATKNKPGSIVLIKAE
jgi:Tol biopolymer transport system component